MRIVVVSIALVALLFLVTDFQGTLTADVVCPNATCPDNVYYERMADGDSVPAPFAYRVLTPWLAGVVPGGFGVLTFAGLVIFLIALYVIQGEVGVRVPLRYVGVAMAAADLWIAEFFAIDRSLVDPIVLAALGVGTLAAMRERWAVALAVLAVGVLDKEVGMLLLVPLGLTAIERRRFEVLAAALAVTAIAFVLPRLIVEPVGSSYGVGVSWPGSISALARDVRALTWDVWGLLFVLALLAGPRVIAQFPALLALLVGTYAQLPFATDTARLLAPAALAVVPFAMLGLQRIVRFEGMALGAVAAVLVGAQFFAFQNQREDLHRLIDALRADLANGGDQITMTVSVAKRSL